MSRNLNMLVSAGLCLASLLCGGCLINASGEKIVGADEDRVSVQFGSDEAMHLFTREVRQSYPHQSDLGHSSFAIPFIIATHEKRVLSENAYFNAQVDKADLDGDGVISDAEARAYAGKPHRD